MIPIITITGGVVRDPEIRFTKAGNAVTSFTVAESDSRWDKETNEWVTTNTVYVPVTIWDETRDNGKQWAHMASEQLRQGAQVAVTGKLITRQWQDKDGQSRSRIEMLAQRFYTQPIVQQQQPAARDKDPWAVSKPADDDQPPF